tara:strand:- start:136 stop:720 length:585 start_codon:yes stop_codon:yes gene_type:complete
MDGNILTLRRTALALGVVALPLAGAIAQTLPGQQPLVAEIAQPADPAMLTDEIVPAEAAAPDFEVSFARFDIDPPAPAVGPRAVDLDSFEPPVEAEPEMWRSGVASYYAARFHGRRTASGERFDMNAMTAAHKTLPFGTKVRVTNPSTGKSVVVRINDRGPFTRGREIDLSHRAASEIGLIARGHATVELALID